MALDIQVGDVLTMKKPHPCGSKRWNVLRVGMDFRMKCLGCDHLAMLPRTTVEKMYSKSKGGQSVMSKVLNFGSLNVDYVYQVDHMLREGETQASTGMEIFLGGKGFNQSCALAKAGVEVYHAGIIGEDGKGFLPACDEYGINRKYIKEMEGKGGHTIIQIDRNAQNSILLFGGTNRKVDEAFIEQVLSDFSEGDFLLLQNEISNLDKIIDKAYARGMKVILNPSPFDSYLDACDMSKIEYFLLNEVEGAQLAGSTNPDTIIEDMLTKYPNAKIVLTLGGDGAIYADRSGVRVHQPIYKVEAVDTTAAGDTFTGYFIAGLLKNLPMEEIMDTCARASSITVSRKGASPSIPTWDEVVKK